MLANTVRVTVPRLCFCIYMEFFMDTHEGVSGEVTPSQCKDLVSQQSCAGHLSPDTEC